jgi:hypothetical protein
MAANPSDTASRNAKAALYTARSRNKKNKSREVVRIIDRREIDQTGRLTTLGAFVNEPAMRIIGH